MNGNKHNFAFRGTIILAVATLALLLAACGGGNDDDNGGDTADPTATTAADVTEEEPTQAGTSGGDGGDAEVDACSLVTQDEAEAALGAATGAGTAENTPPFFGCRYETEDFDSVSVSVLAYDDASQAEGGYQLAIDINDYPELDGLGDRAYDGRPLTGVTVLSGRYEVDVDVSGEDSDADFETAKQLAAAAIDRLP